MQCDDKHASEDSGDQSSDTENDDMQELLDEVKSISVEVRKLHRLIKETLSQINPSLKWSTSKQTPSTLEQSQPKESKSSEVIQSSIPTTQVQEHNPMPTINGHQHTTHTSYMDRKSRYASYRPRIQSTPAPLKPLSFLRPPQQIQQSLSSNIENSQMQSQYANPSIKEHSAFPTITTQAKSSDLLEKK